VSGPFVRQFESGGVPQHVRVHAKGKAGPRPDVNKGRLASGKPPPPYAGSRAGSDPSRHLVHAVNAMVLEHQPSPLIITAKPLRVRRRSAKSQLSDTLVQINWARSQIP